MIRVRLVELLKEKNRSKYWIRQKMNITSRNMNRFIKGETTSISFKYINDFCKYLDCTPGDLLEYIEDK